MLGFLLALCALGDGGAPAARIGDRVADFTLKDIRFVSRSLADFGTKKAVVIVFLDARCPVAARYVPRLNALAEDFESRGVLFLGVSASPGESLVELAAFALERKARFAVFKDFEQSALGAIGARRTPEAAVLDAERVLRYRGRIDEAFRVAGESPGEGQAHLRRAIEAVLSGKAPEPAETPVEGCLITPRREPERPGVNYAEHVAPILQKHCQSCHRPGQTAPFSLLSYEDAARRAAMLREVVEERFMPPAFNDPRHGAFANVRALSGAEIETIAAWAAAGAPRGDESKLPPPIAWPESRWLIGEPDLVLPIPEEIRIPPDGFVDYRYAVPDHVFEHETWVSAIQILPGNHRAVHHANLYIVHPPPFDAIPEFLTGYVPGGEATRYPAGAGIRIPRGARLRLQIHYVTTGKEETDRTRIGLVFAKEPIRSRVRILLAINRRFEIPPGDPAHEVRARAKFARDAIGIGLYVHMHLRGKDMSFVERHPDGREEMLLSVPNYNFNWQLSYVWPEGGRRFAAGTEIETISHYDNSPLNPFNPDPSKTVREGQQSFEEMNYGFLFYVDAEEKLDIRVDPKTGAPLTAGG